LPALLLDERWADHPRVVRLVVVGLLLLVVGLHVAGLLVAGVAESFP
jgi:hypothetical protein